jgi:hypothetical protein
MNHSVEFSGAIFNRLKPGVKPLPRGFVALNLALLFLSRVNMRILLGPLNHALTERFDVSDRIREQTQFWDRFLSNPPQTEHLAKGTGGRRKAQLFGSADPG